MKHFITVALIFVSVAAVAQHDVITFKDSITIIGTVEKVQNGKVHFARLSDGWVTKYDTADILVMKLADSHTAPVTMSLTKQAGGNLQTAGILGLTGGLFTVGGVALSVVGALGKGNGFTYAGAVMGGVGLICTISAFGELIGAGRKLYDSDGEKKKGL